MKIAVIGGADFIVTTLRVGGRCCENTVKRNCRQSADAASSGKFLFLGKAAGG